MSHGLNRLGPRGLADHSRLGCPLLGGEHLVNWDRQVAGPAGTMDPVTAVVLAEPASSEQVAVSAGAAGGRLATFQAAARPAAWSGGLSRR